MILKNLFVLHLCHLLDTAVIATPLGRSRSSVDINDVFIAVKTSGKFHKSRLEPVLNTWYRTAPPSTHFFTDVEDPDLEDRIKFISGLSGVLVQTGCPSDHSRTALSCKLEHEMTHFIRHSDSPWFCHLDDDNYLNTPALLKLLAGYPSSQDWYLGKVSIPNKLEILDRLRLPERKSARFWFATGGAGFCLSRPLVDKMRPYVVDGKFSELADKIRLPDDVSLGYLLEIILKVPLTQVPNFHSHLEPLRLVKDKDLDKEITFSYAKYEDESMGMNVVEVENSLKNEEADSTRFYAIHCKLFGECDL